MSLELKVVLILELEPPVELGVGLKWELVQKAVLAQALEFEAELKLDLMLNWNYD